MVVNPHIKKSTTRYTLVLATHWSVATMQATAHSIRILTVFPRGKLGFVYATALICLS